MDMEKRSNTDSIKSLLNEMEGTLRNSKKALLSSGGYVIDKERFEYLLGKVRANLPAELTQAYGIVEDKDKILNAAEKEYNEKILRAQEEAKQIKTAADDYARRTQEDAVARAQAYYDQKVDEGNQALLAYQNQATLILNEATAQAAQMVEEDEIKIRAKVEADEVRSTAYDEAGQLREQTFAYLSDVITDLDEAFAQKQTDIRRLRQNLTVREQQQYNEYDGYDNSY